MIGEAMLAIKALDSAFVMVQGAIAKKKEVEDMAGEVGKFFTAKKKLKNILRKRGMRVLKICWRVRLWKKL